MTTPFTHTNGKIEGTKIALMIGTSIICARVAAPLFGDFTEIDPTLATGVLAALGGTYGGRQHTRARYERHKFTIDRGTIDDS